MARNGERRWREGEKVRWKRKGGEVIGFVLQMEGFFVSLCSSIIRNLYT